VGASLARLEEAVASGRVSADRLLRALLEGLRHAASAYFDGHRLLGAALERLARARFPDLAPESRAIATASREFDRLRGAARAEDSAALHTRTLEQLAEGRDAARLDTMDDPTGVTSEAQATPAKPATARAVYPDASRACARAVEKAGDPDEARRILESAVSQFSRAA
jgi:hypothetical protein